MEQNAETKYDLTAEQLRRLPQEAYLLVDMRDEIAYGHGRIPGAVRMDRERLLGGDCPLPPDRKIIVYCMKGLFSREVARRLAGKGYEAYHLAGGYGQWLLDLMRADGIQKEADSPQDDPCTAREHSPDSALDDFQAQIEKSLRKKFYRTIFSKFTKAINQYELLREGDRVAVCISGGKDSMLMAKLFQELLRHHKFPFELVFLVMDPGYDELNRKIIESNARLLRIPITVFETQIFDAVYQVEKSPCYLCARMRRGHLYRKAQELGCNKIALGHHYDDVIETILMGMLYGGQVQTM
ncbi:MAG: ATPase, partial [Clostridium sp.]|nr:ATPase [Clostridium sp.]